MTSSAASLVPVNTTLGILLAALLFLATAIAGWCHLDPHPHKSRAREILVAGLRAVVQLALVSVVITWAVESVPGLLVFLVLMLTVAVRTAGRRITGNHTWWLAAAPIAAGVLPVVVALLGTGLVPLESVTLIPVTGILIGGALTATVLAGRRALDELSQRRGEVEAAMALGLSDRDARMEIARPAASDALLPGLDQTRTVGLVTLPGAFVGMLLGGSSPVLAGAVQLFVLIALMAVQAIAVAVTLELVARHRLYRSALSTHASSPSKSRRLPKAPAPTASRPGASNVGQ
ncbi:putative ABC transport system permease protein [Streptomyces griseochromogenes]|uniref:ABC transport system permease protein n=1 Tax=Streptomyces griseochromogenes TaxID=68214 RepID=A0ABS4M7Q6_9ACTN|nr:ABC transporter permease [Streptomyces griseochromogenes]MBP2055709.1 putative ABC transport system permease protein [Streptomyces griseochromogenes]